jgi:hypothetical protein
MSVAQTVALLKDIAIFAVTIGGAFTAYLKFVGLKPKLDLSCEAKQARVNDINFVHVKYSVTNKGVVRVRITQEGSRLILEKLNTTAVDSAGQTPKFESLGTFGIYRTQEFVEPDETITEECLYSTGGIEGIRSELRIMSKPELMGRSYSWTVSSIALFEPKADNNTGER